MAGFTFNLFVESDIAAQSTVVVLQAGPTADEFTDGMFLIHLPQVMVLVPSTECVVYLLCSSEG